MRLAICLLASRAFTVGARADEVKSAAIAPFPNFESSVSHPLLVSGDGRHLFAVNPPDHRLEVFAVTDDGTLSHAAAVFTGLEPVSVGRRDASGRESIGGDTPPEHCCASP